MLPILQEKDEDPRITRTRNLLEQAFLDLLKENDFQSLSVQQITDQAGVNRATFYAHFPDKYALLDHVIRIQFALELQERTLSVCSFSEENLLALITAVLEFTHSAGESCSSSYSQFEAVMEFQIKNQVQEIIEKWLENVDTQLAPSISAIAASSALYGLVQHWRRDRKHAPSEEYASQILPTIAANLNLAQPA
jgi:AcrR family transcriptional regulator